MITTMVWVIIVIIILVLLMILVLKVTKKYHLTWYWCQDIRDSNMVGKGQFDLVCCQDQTTRGSQRVSSCFFSFVSNGILMIFRWLKVISSWRWSGDEGLSWVSKTDPDSLLPDDLCIQDRFNACKTPINVFKDHHLQKIWLDIVCPSSTFDINNLKTGQALQQRGLPNEKNMNKMEWAE